ncbi:MAG TPA: hypothetical protein VIQ31_39565 [Phormidium sp.]
MQHLRIFTECGGDRLKSSNSLEAEIIYLSGWRSSVRVNWGTNPVFALLLT